MIMSQSFKFVETFFVQIKKIINDTFKALFWQEIAFLAIVILK